MKIFDKGILIDPSLARLIRAERSKMLKTLNILEKKFLKAEKKKFEAEIEQLKKVKEHLFPDGNFQERHENFMKFYLRKGDRYIHDMIHTFNPLLKKYVVIT